MAQVNITLKISLEEANLLVTLLDEGEQRREDFLKLLKEEGRDVIAIPGERTVVTQDWQRCGQELISIQAMRRGIKGA